MDSDEEDVSENDILDWYSGRVGEIWDSASASTFGDLGPNLANVFRQVMDGVRQRGVPVPAAPEENGVNGHLIDEADMEVEDLMGREPIANVAMTAGQLMSLLQDDDDWLEKDPTGEEEDEDDEITLSVRLKEEPNSDNEPPKNVKGVSRISKLTGPADSAMITACSTAAGLISFTVKCLVCISLFIVTVYVSSLLHNPTQKWFLKHAQHYIYPSMRLLRIVTLPWVQKYPSLTDWHEETCLIPNPLYWQRTLDCWSCIHIDSVRVVDTAPMDFSQVHYHSGTPLLVKGSQMKVDVVDIGNLYTGNKWQFSQGIGTFSSGQHRNLSDFLNSWQHLDDDVHISWKVIRVGTGRLFRQLFPRPAFIPRDTEVALHKYLFIDGPKSPAYKLPITEFANVWLQQGNGARMVRLIPSPSCSASCTSLSILLQPGDMLFYNWQFWNPETAPADGNEMSVTYVGSFY